MPNDRTTAPRWSVYLLRCGSGALYTGIATDVHHRLAEHRNGQGAKYLRGKGPLRLVFEKAIGDKCYEICLEACAKVGLVSAAKKAA